MHKELKSLLKDQEFLTIEKEVTFFAHNIRLKRQEILYLMAGFLEAVLRDFKDTVKKEADGISWHYPHAELNFSATWSWDSQYENCEDIITAFERNESLFPLFALAEGIASLRTDRGLIPLSKQDLSLSRRESEEETPALSTTFKIKNKKPVISDFLCSALPNATVHSPGKVDEEETGTLFMLFHPLIFDTCTNSIFGSVGVSLVFPDSDTSKRVGEWTKNQQEEFWIEFLNQFKVTCKQLLKTAYEGQELFSETEIKERSLFDAEETEDNEVDASIITGSPESIIAPEAPPALPFLLAFQRDVKIDQFAMDLTTHLHKVRLPKKWPKKSWEELTDDEIRRLQAEEGNEAFTTSLKRYRGGRPALRSKAEKLLKIREGMTKQGYRFRDPSSGEEFLTKVFQIRDGYLEIGFSLYGLTSILTEEGRRKAREEAEKFQSSLFPEITQKIVARHKLLEDSHLMMQALMNCLAVNKTNEFSIPAEAFKVLLNIGNDPNWLGRIRGALYALANFKLRVKSFDLTPKYEAYGSYLNHYEYFGAGPGASGQGTFLLNLNPKFFRFFQIFESQKIRLENREVFRLDFTKHVPNEDFEQSVIYQTLADAGDAFYSSAAGLTETQRNLATFLTTQITRRKHPVSMILGNPSKRETFRLTARGFEELEHRIYDNSFCPLLPKGKEFEGALGRMKRYPESGWKLIGRQNETRTPNLLSEMGYDLAGGRAVATREKTVQKAIEDIKLVIEDYLEGLVTIYCEGHWIRINDAIHLPVPILRKTRWFLFLPKGWLNLRREKWEKTQKERALKGETPAAWKVTEDPQAARRAQNTIREGLQRENKVSLAEALWIRLYKKRKELKLSQAVVGKYFGVSQVKISHWEAGTEPDAHGKVKGKPISRELIPLVERWLELDIIPSKDELATRKNYRSGKR